MIIGFFLQIFYMFLAFVINLLPVYAIPTGITQAIATIWGDINAWSFIFPVATLAQVLVVAMIFHGAIFAWHYFHLIFRKIRGA